MRPQWWQRKTVFVASVLVGAIAIGGAVAVAIPGVSTVSGRSISAVKVVRSVNNNFTSSTSWQDIPGSSTSITVPASSRAIILARFSAPTFCIDTADPRGVQDCRVRILIGGQEAAPSTAKGLRPDVAIFDTSSGWTQGGEDWIEAHSIERSRGGLRPGTYTVKVQYQVQAVTTVFSLKGWNLTVERIRAG